MEQIITVSWVLGLGIIGINLYYLSTGFIGWLIHSSLPKAANVLIGIVVFPLMAVYISAILYLMFRKDRVVTFKEATKVDPNASEHHLEEGISHSDDQEVLSLDGIPPTEDLASVPSE